MARYTECLVDYLNNGHSLPSVFSSITGFADLFTGFYCSSEIGFETETLFEIRLETKAQLVIPLYATRISAYESVLSQLGTPTATITDAHTGTISDAGSVAHTGTIGNSGSDTHSGSDAVAHTGTVSSAGSVTAGAQTKTHTELPMNANTATPSSKDVADTYTNSDSKTDTYANTDTTTHGLSISHTNTETFNNTDTNGNTRTFLNTDTHTYTGLTANDQINLIKYYEGKILNLKQACLDEFKPLFMVIY